MDISVYRPLLLGGLWLATCGCQTHVWGQDAAPDLEETSSPSPGTKNWSDEVTASAERVQLFLTAEAKQPLDMKRVFQWSDPVLPEGASLCLLYLHQGRPVASCKVFANGRSLVHTFVSMSDQPLVARADNEPIWTPDKAGLEFRKVPDLAPAEDAARRRIQMKVIARQFSALTDNDEAARQQAVPELRLLPTPLHRYPQDLASDDGVFDGAVFAFVVGGGNPQLFLVLEAVREDEQAIWRYALSRRTLAKLQVSHRGQKVWAVEFFPWQRMTRTASFGKVNLPVVSR